MTTADPAVHEQLTTTRRREWPWARLVRAEVLKLRRRYGLTAFAALLTVAAVSGAGLAAAFAAPNHGGWATVGMAGVAVGLAAGLASVAPALAAIYLRPERLISIAAASLSFGASVYLVARSLKSGARAGA
jgi:hypothetical protein